jgi:transcriptional regulator with PAS, ATPase and Fis domain
MDDSNRSVAKRQIARLLGGASNPIYVLSEDNTIIFANEALGKLLDRPVESLLGIQCSSLGMTDQKSESEIASLLSPPGGWSRRSIKTVPFELRPDPNTASVRCLVPLEDSENSPLLCLIGARSTSDTFGFCDDPLGEVLNVLRSTRARYKHGNALWFLQGKSVRVKQVLEQVQLASQTSCNVWITGPVGAGQRSLVEAIHAFSHSDLQSPDNVPSLIRIECRLMDRDILISMFELIADSQKKSNRTQCLLIEGFNALPSDCLSILAKFVEQQPHLRYFVTLSTDSNSKDSTEPEITRSKDWDAIFAIAGVLQIELPRLTDRLDDLRVLVASWLESTENQGRKNLETTSAFCDLLCAYPWPDDIEEFSQTMQHALKSSGDSVQLDVAHLPINLRTCVSHAEQFNPIASVDLDAVLEDVERTMILRAMELSPSNKTAAAKLLNISRARLLRRLQQWGMLAEAESLDRDDDLPVFHEVK